MRILTTDDLKEVNNVKLYLEYAFSKRKAKKNCKVYINICAIFEVYPNIIKEILINIPVLGYYKDYFYVLSFSTNAELNEHIYDIIIDQITKDIKSIENNEEISTMGKWLPREKSKINKRCKIVDLLSARLFPDDNKNTARKKYRQLKTQINIKLGTLESKICTQQYQMIDYDKVSPYALKITTKILEKHEICRYHMDIHETKVLQELKLFEFVKKIISNKYPWNKIDDLWNQNDYYNEIPFFQARKLEMICIADLSNSTYHVNGEFLAIGILLLTDKCSCIKDKIIVGDGNLIKLEGGTMEKIKKLMKYVGPSQNIDAKKYYETYIENSEHKNVCFAFITVKEISNIQFLQNKQVSYLHFIPCYDTYDIVYFNGQDIITARNNTYIQCLRENTHKKKIMSIINASFELNNQKISIIYTLMFIIFCIAIGYFINH